MIFVSSIRSMDVELSLAEVMDRLDTHPANRLSRTNRGQDHLNSKRPKFSDTRKHLRRLQTGPLVEPNHRSSIEGMTSQAWGHEAVRRLSVHLLLRRGPFRRVPRRAYDTPCPWWCQPHRQHRTGMPVVQSEKRNHAAEEYLKKLGRL